MLSRACRQLCAASVAFCVRLCCCCRTIQTSNQWTGCKIHGRFAVRSNVVICVLFIMSCCHALSKLDSSANEIYGILVASSLRSECYSPGPFGLLNPVHSMTSESNYYIVHSLRTLQSSLLLPSPDTAQTAVFFANSKSTVFNSWRKPTTDFNCSLRLAPQCIAFSSDVHLHNSAHYTPRCNRTHVNK